MEFKAIEEKLLLRNYSINTRKVYLSMLKDYDAFCERESLNPENSAHEFILEMITHGKAVATQNQAINAIKFYWEHILGKPKSRIEIDRPMKTKPLPSVLSLEEVNKIFAAIENSKHLLIIKTIYGCGLRIGELCSLRIEDIDGKRMRIHIRQGKGRKDRFVPLPEDLLKSLRTYYKEYRPKEFLFEGQPEKGKEDTPRMYSTTSIRAILNRATKKAGIRKRVKVHTLRHSYATHLYEHGVNLRSIQVILGHSSSKTTEIYTRVSKQHLDKLPSPLDFLKNE
jgi:site-specific recombinase XerD